LRIPRIHSDGAALSLGDPLKTLGLGVALSGSADFSGIADPAAAQETLHIGKVMHKVYLDVAEKGTEAAAATAVTLDGATSLPPDPPKSMTFDRPFYVVIRDVPTGMVLFTARIVKL
jgi:serpin B